VHGSAPPLAGKNMANPMAAILTLAMMLADLGAADAARAVEQAVCAAIGQGVGTADVGGKLGTREVGDWIARRVRDAGVK